MAKKKTNFYDDNYQFNPNDDLNIFYNLTFMFELLIKRILVVS